MQCCGDVLCVQAARAGVVLLTVVVCVESAGGVCVCVCTECLNV